MSQFPDSAFIEQRDLGEHTQTSNEQGVTIVSLDVKVVDGGEIYIRAKDPAYATPHTGKRIWYIRGPLANDEFVR